MGDFLLNTLQADILSERRRDAAAGRQSVMSYFQIAALMGFSFTRDATELSIPESYAIQGLSLSTGPREAQAQNLAARTPQAA